MHTDYFARYGVPPVVMNGGCGGYGGCECQLSRHAVVMHGYSVTMIANHVLL